METAPPSPPEPPNYHVKRIEPIVMSSDVQARLFTMAPGETIPWHLHRTAADHYFVLEGSLTVVTREPEQARTIAVGGSYRIDPETPHLITNRSATDCRFLLLQGVGRRDWVKVGG